MPKMFRVVALHEPVKKGTSQGKKPITSTMNKHKDEVINNIEDKENNF